jgi:D-3-phosphoglycerate dehydrogenase / 2-oxoglutarate reductase
MKIRVVVTDSTFPSLDVESAILEPLGCQIVAGQWKTPAELIPAVADADHVITQFAPVNAQVVAAMQKVRVIVRYGIGVDNVDLEAARARNIPVCNVPDYCINEVADHTLAFVLAATRQVVANCLGLRGGQWKLAVPAAAMKTLAEMTVGVLGFGRIGREVARRLQAFGCRLVVFDPHVPASQVSACGYIPVGLDELATDSDLITLHCPSTAETRQIINRARLAQMKPGVILINASRGDLVEPAALIEALQQGRVGAAALDVFDPEPLPADSPLLRMENVIVSAHIASVSVKAVRKLRESAAQTVARVIRGEPLVNVVNGVRRG